MENLVIDPAFWRNKRVLLTGHTGFKGGWLALWLQQMQAQVFGLALPPATQPNLFEVANVAVDMCSTIGDIADHAIVEDTFRQIQPEIVIHMAAQSLVRYSYLHPLQTYQSNVMGTLHILEALRHTESVKAAVLITTDKCYQNREWIWRYRENDALGGHDPYSSSKACVELMVDSYRKSFFGGRSSTAVATARAGNVIGGGDWAPDRLLPDIIKAYEYGEKVLIRNPYSVRPWQHVLEPLSGYLGLAQRLYMQGQEYAEAWNFGPYGETEHTVQWLVEQIAKYWPDLKAEVTMTPQPHEAKTLKLDCSKARERLKCRERWTLPEAIQRTLAWHQQHRSGGDMRQFCFEQIEDYLCKQEAHA